jgi:acyl carrier protein phosphodiesterase
MMNYLAHAYLSFQNKDVIIGNMISDFVKGKAKFNYTEDIQKGIALHRMIDNFTDVHFETKRAKEFLKPFADRYSAVFIDIIYDHFLARDQKEFPNESLEYFAERTYQLLGDNVEILPERFARILPYMTTQNWFLNYRFTSGIENSFNSVFRRRC